MTFFHTEHVHSETVYFTKMTYAPECQALYNGLLEAIQNAAISQDLNALLDWLYKSGI